MITRFYLIVNSGGSVRAVKSYRQLDADEVAIQMKTEVPDIVFAKPRLEASIKIPAESVSAVVIDGEVADKVGEAIKSSTGLDFSIKVVEPDEEE